MPAVIAHLLAFAAFASTSPVVDRVAGLDVTQDRVAAQVADSEDAARAAAVDEALLHRAALDGGAGTDERYIPLVADRVAAGGPKLLKKVSKANGLMVDATWLAQADGTRKDLPKGCRVVTLEPGVALKAGDRTLRAGDAADLATAQRWLTTEAQRLAAISMLADGAPEARGAVVADWLEQELGPLVEAEDIVESRLKQWYEAHRSEFAEEQLWLRHMSTQTDGERARAQLQVFRAHIEIDPSRFDIYARILHPDTADAGALAGPITPRDPGPVPAEVAALALREGRDGLTQVITANGRLYLILIEKRQGGFPDVVDRVQARVRDEALGRRKEQLLATLRSDTAG